MTVTLRPAQPDDEELLYRLYALSRRDEMLAWGWSEAQQQMFLRMQFTARQAHYRDQFPHAEHRIILLDEAPVGRMVVVRNEDHIRLADIALLPEHRGRGLGASLIKELLDEARSAARPVQLFVERHNPAIRLYERLGFRIVGDIDSHLSMEWEPNS
jgi:ribosomal protein S18 acetylase RimI-like enzyme